MGKQKMALTIKTLHDTIVANITELKDISLSELEELTKNPITADIANKCMSMVFALKTNIKNTECDDDEN